MTQVETAPVVRRAPSGRVRDPYVDNLKGVLICLVAIGHTIGQFIDLAPGAHAVYTFIYLFHMPAFVLLCGVLTSSPDLDGRRVVSMVRSLLVPYVIFQIAYIAFFRARGHSISWNVDALLTPVYHLWFLVALFVWRLLAPFFVRIRCAALLAVLISLAAGMSKELGGGLTLDRTVAFLPFFVFGLLLGKKALHLPSGPGARVGALLVVAVSLPAAGLFQDTFGRGWLFWRATYRSLHVPGVEGMGIRLGLIAWALILTAAVFVLVPRRRTVATGWGERSMYPYLLHAFFVQVFGWLHLPITTVWQFALAVLGAVAIVAILGSGVVKRLLHFVVEPRLTWLFRPIPGRGVAA